MSTLTPVQQKFILHWGEMGNRWGINRTVAHIHALLLISEKPLHSEEIAVTLSVARSNVSTSLKELVGWEIIKPVHVLGDRREHYESLKDIWEIFRIIAEKRKKREIDPTLSALRECLEGLEQDSQEALYTRSRLADILDFFETVTSCYEQANHLPTVALKQIMKLENRMEKLLALLPGPTRSKDS